MKMNELKRIYNEEGYGTLLRKLHLTNKKDLIEIVVDNYIFFNHIENLPFMTKEKIERIVYNMVIGEM